jgi:hypothetical protein
MESLGLTKEGNEYRVVGRTGRLIKINKLTKPQLKEYGAKYTTFTNKNTRQQILNKIYAAKTKLRAASKSGNSFASAILASKTNSAAAAAAAHILSGLKAKPKVAGGKARVSALLNIAGKKSSSPSSAASIGLLKQFGASGHFRRQGLKGPIKIGKLTVPQLKNYARKYNVNVNGLTKRDEILAVVYKKKFGKNLYKVKPLKGSSSSKKSSSARVHPVKGSSPSKKSSSTRMHPAVGPVKPAPASLGLLRQLGASGGYRFRGVKGPKKANKHMTVAALKRYAMNHNVNVNGLRKNAIIAAIHKKMYGGSSSGSSRHTSNYSGLSSGKMNKIFSKSSGSGPVTASQLNKLLASN